MQKPLPTEHNPYFKKYIDLVSEENFLKALSENTTTAIKFFESLPKEKHNYKYAADKWTVKEVLMHITDTERVMSYRMLAAVRGDNKNAMPSMDENLYAKNVDVSKRTLEDLLSEFKAVRFATEKIVENTTEEQSKLTANTVSHPVSARALAYIIIGHVLHHMNVIKERYL